MILKAEFPPSYPPGEQNRVLQCSESSVCSLLFNPFTLFPPDRPTPSSTRQNLENGKNNMVKKAEHKRGVKADSLLQTFTLFTAAYNSLRPVLHISLANHRLNAIHWMAAAQPRWQWHICFVGSVNVMSATEAEDLINASPSEAFNWLKSTGAQSVLLPTGLKVRTNEWDLTKGYVWWQQTTNQSPFRCSF